MNSPHVDHDYVGLVGSLPQICVENCAKIQTYFSQSHCSIAESILCNHLVFLRAFSTEISFPKIFGT